MQRESHEFEEFEAFEARLPVLIMGEYSGLRYRFRRQKLSLEVSSYSQCPLRDELMYVQLVHITITYISARIVENFCQLENVIKIRSIRPPPSPRYIRCKYVCKVFNGNFGVACSEDPK